MSLINDLVSKATAIVTWQPGTPGFGATLLAFYASVRDAVVALYDLVLTKAAGDHVHDGDTPILSRGAEGDRLPTGVTLHLRTDDPGLAEVIEGGTLRAVLVNQLGPMYFTEIYPDEQASFEPDQVRGTAVFPAGADAYGWQETDPAPDDGLILAINASLRMSTATATTVNMDMLYQVFDGDAARDPVKTRWEPANTYTTGWLVIPPDPNGHVYSAVSAGLTLTTVPVWPTGSGVTIADGTVLWQEAGAGMSLVSGAFVSLSTAWQPIEAEWVIPVTLEAGQIVVFGPRRETGGDGHDGDAHLSDLSRSYAPEEV